MTIETKKKRFNTVAEKILKPKSIHDFNKTNKQTDKSVKSKKAKKTSLKKDKITNKQTDKSVKLKKDNKTSLETKANPIKLVKPQEEQVSENSSKTIKQETSNKEVKSADKIKWEFRISKDLAEAINHYIYKKSDINNRLYRQDLVVQAIEEFLEKEGFWKKRV